MLATTYHIAWNLPGPWIALAVMVFALGCLGYILFNTIRQKLQTPGAKGESQVTKPLTNEQVDPIVATTGEYSQSLKEIVNADVLTTECELLVTAKQSELNDATSKLTNAQTEAQSARDKSSTLWEKLKGLTAGLS